MAKNPENIIDENMEDLVESIDVKNTALFERLTELKLFRSSDVEYIKVSDNITSKRLIEIYYTVHSFEMDLKMARQISMLLTTRKLCRSISFNTFK